MSKHLKREEDDRDEGFMLMIIDHDDDDTCHIKALYKKNKQSSKNINLLKRVNLINNVTSMKRMMDYQSQTPAFSLNTRGSSQ